MDVFDFFVNLTNCEEEIETENKAQEEAIKKSKKDGNNTRH